MKRLTSTLISLVVIAACPHTIAAQAIPEGPVQEVLERIRGDIFLRMIEARGIPAVTYHCLGLGGQTVPVEDPSEAVLAHVREHLDEVRLSNRIPGEVIPFSECDESSFSSSAGFGERGQPFLITRLAMDAPETEVYSSGHAEIGPGEIFDCVYGLVDGQWQHRFCRVMHEHHGRFELMRKEGVGRPIF